MKQGNITWIRVLDYIYYINLEICVKLNNHVYSIIHFSIRRGHFLLSFLSKHDVIISMTSTKDYDVIDIIMFCICNVIVTNLICIFIIICLLKCNWKGKVSKTHTTAMYVSHRLLWIPLSEGIPRVYTIL